MLRSQAASSALVLMLALGGDSACAADSSGSGAYFDAAAQSLSDEGFRELYALDYDKSQKTFALLERTEPDKAFSYLFDAGALWWQASNERGLFKRRPELLRRFKNDVRLSIKQASALASSADPRAQADGHFILGLAYGARAQSDLLSRHWFRAYRAGRKVVYHLQKCLDIDPDYADAKFGLGWFECDLSRYSGFLGFLTRSLLGIRGDEAKGIALLTQASRQATYVRRQASIVLVTFYIGYKRDYAQALAIVRALRRDYPQSSYFQFLDAALLFKTKDPAGSFSAARDFFAAFSRDEKASQPKLLTLLCSFTAAACPDRSQTEGALDWFGEAIADEKRLVPEHFPRGWGEREHLAWLSTLHLYRGYAERALGLSSLAREDFERVKNDYPDFWDNRARAGFCLKNPCDGREVRRYLRDLAGLERKK